MLADFRRSYAALLTSGGQLFLLFIPFKLKGETAWYICLGLIAALSFIIWISVLRRLRAVNDFPLSSIASAAQGYVKLRGRGKPLNGLPLHAPFTGVKCLWYRLRVEQTAGFYNHWVSKSSDESIASFQLDDGTGVCVVDPEGAEIFATRKATWDDAGERYTLYTLLEGDDIQVLGSLKTDSTSCIDTSLTETVADLLTDWKQDQASLRKRFDLNKDGEIDMHEWELARCQARREAEQYRRQAIIEHRDIHWVRRPNDGRIFLVSALLQDQLKGRYTYWAWAQAAIFLMALGGLAMVPLLP